MDMNFDKFIKNNLIEAISLDKYYYLITNLHKTDVSKDEEYQTKFNAFYKVRRDAKKRKIFYDYFESIKDNKNIKYEDIITYLYKKTGNVEASFSSKILATISPNMPIIDQFVLQNLNEELSGKSKGEKIKSSIEVYYRIVEKENNLLTSKEIKSFVKDFHRMFKEYNLSDIKILDYYLWKNR